VRLLLDTHAFLWWMADKARLSDRARVEIGAARTVVYLSAAVGWEIVLKQARGKLDAPSDLTAAARDNRFTVLPVGLSHVQAVRELPRSTPTRSTACSSRKPGSRA
jgi:PIN domain nuclease of toxin-antitoxin system